MKQSGEEWSAHLAVVLAVASEQQELPEDWLGGKAAMLKKKSCASAFQGLPAGHHDGCVGEGGA
eukprot:373106-Prorocentrum_lima.AAC.1